MYVWTRERTALVRGYAAAWVKITLLVITLLTLAMIVLWVMGQS
jgi:hypothetical protein